MTNQDEMQVAYNVKRPIEILFDHMETGKEFTIAGNSTFSNRKLVDIGVTKILVTHEYTHAYCTWKSITADN